MICHISNKIFNIQKIFDRWLVKFTIKADSSTWHCNHRPITDFLILEINIFLIKFSLDLIYHKFMWAILYNTGGQSPLVRVPQYRFDRFWLHRHCRIIPSKNIFCSHFFFLKNSVLRSEKSDDLKNKRPKYRFSHLSYSNTPVNKFSNGC